MHDRTTSTFRTCRRTCLSEQGTIGGINLYSTEQTTIEEHAPQIAEVFAAHAAVTLGRVRELDQLQAAIETRQRIGQAVGVIIERYKLDEERAFGFLVRMSSQSNTKLRDVAAAVVEDALTRNDLTRNAVDK